MRGLRVSGADSVRATRAPSVSGVYAFTATATGVGAPDVLRSSMLRGLDSAMIKTITASSDLWRDFQKAARAPLRFQVRLSDDSLDDSRSLAWGTFPRMPIHDAAPLPTNSQPAFPEEARADSLEHGEVVLRFIVDRDGIPAMETVEIVRASGLAFARAAITALPQQKFTPATIRGCPVAQVVDYPFIFDASQRTPPR
jgi:TonB family protein